ncbi:ATP-binding cassette domain-containing protein [Bariatricus massiliensis]|uniref:ATP-binding cassette domain-containing protein n=1 Tax=Bariatricus massiliensis TaxID=1745713 RepID=A0ABS8DFV4_9FIRM|nr:ATP-binding cassette domain-containing protein [Bariatricus massiliensis]MCB7304188.1 ATP-binding cassette domain-containing protein [Bariatricus massiliensis]MCB7374381.1 ATP-binding cassette domain-containing protein [Bariatricus massiliensis]MCB7387298.1 ATP-binding cassette domain-containing protein [Bariatricus massiliensis]MCB7411460.1 ATP-binding cassette domain-containing protein [Bariatricus massiliensis]MCQ5252594.1 ATP-binding cassette domain-containing protein [Bariatricus massi
MSVSLKISNVSKVFDKNVALNNVNLDIQAGEFICLLGPSGCGKSTLLRIIAGLEQPSEGKVYIGDRDVTNLPPSRRNFGIMFQSYALFPNLSAFENVAYGLRNKKMKTRDIEERVNRLFDMIKLSNAKNRLPSEMSGGEQQRVALARALATEPDFLLLDEPLSALDAKVRISLRKEICNIQKELKLTTIMVTHDQDEALTMADRIIVMNKAVVMQSGTPEEIYEKPENQFVADFIGSINFIDDRKSKAYGFSQKGETAIRPEKIAISREKQESDMRGKITDIEFRGFYDRVSVNVNHIIYGDLNLAVDVPFQTAKAMEFHVNDNVFIKLPREEMLTFETRV